MTRNLAALAALTCLLNFSAAGFADTRDGPGAAHKKCGAVATCNDCEPRTLILESGRPPFRDENGVGVRSCTAINTTAEWDAYCSDNVVPGCPLLGDGFFAQHTVFAVAIDTLTSRPCEGSSDPEWSLDCVASTGGVRVVKQRPGAWCLCSAMPQHLQRLFLASAVPKTPVASCRACEEVHVLDCLP